MPGRGGAGAPGAAGPDGRVLNRATISGRGGTTGLACGCPARFGLAGGRSGCDGDACDVGMLGRVGCGRGGAGILGKLGEAGRGAPGIPDCVTSGALCTIGGLGASPIPAGSGCLGPDKIWPGLGGGTGLAGTADPRVIGLVIGLAGTGIEGGA